MEKIPDIVLLGSISIDRIMSFQGRYRDLIKKDKLHVLSLSILVDTLRHTRGGIAANIAYNLSLLGDRSSLLASVGTDGTEYVKDLGSIGIDTSHIHFSELPTSTFTVMTDQEDNQIGGFYPGAMSDSASLNLSPWHKTNSIVVISPYDPSTMNRLVIEAKKDRQRLIYDIGQQVSNVSVDDLRSGIAAAKLLIVNDYELSVITERTGLKDQTISSRIPVIITLGEKGSLLQFRGVTTKIAMVKPSSVVDPTGAGDAYRAGFLYGLRRSWPLIKCCQLGSTIASFAVEKLGTQEHKFTLVQVNKRYFSTFKEELWQ